jgi:hypothetical protein
MDSWTVTTKEDEKEGIATLLATTGAALAIDDYR